MRKTVLVTGGAGYIGSHACKALDAAGYRPVVYDDLSNGHEAAVQWGPLVRGDVRDSDRLTAALIEHQAGAVIHFAGLIEVGRSVERPDLFWDHNLNGVAAVLKAMRAASVTRLVFSSTAAVYGAPDTALDTLAETAPLQPINPYGDSKLAGERMIAAACRAFGLEAIALRYFNAAGADPDGRLGEAHQPETHLIPLAIEAALDPQRPLTLYGRDYDTRDGSCLRDYVHVSDLARAHVLALDCPLEAGGFEAINLGQGRGVTVLELIEAVARACGRRPAVIEGPPRPGDPPMLVADPARARRRLRWAPAHDLDVIVGTAVAWRQDPAFGPCASGRAGLAAVA